MYVMQNCMTYIYSFIQKIVRLSFKNVSGFYASNHMCIEIMITKCDTYNIVYVIMTNLEMD